MNSAAHQAPVDTRWDYELRLLAWLAVCASVLSFLYYYRHGEVLLYGDAVAHINIARRVFDSKTPGLLQLGTVWLPLPHLLILPFVISDTLWQSGAGGSLPSMVAYVFGVLGVFRLVRAVLQPQGISNSATRIAAWTGALIYGANPNLLYMQSTAMGEALYLTLFIWVTMYFVEYVNGNAKALVKCGWCLIGACLTRYDGWFLGAMMVVVAAILQLRRGEQKHDEVARALRGSRKAFARFLVLAAAAPAFWFAYNGIVYRNPLEFANGPYSAKVIEQKSGTVNPARGSVPAATSLYLKAIQLNIGQERWQMHLFLALSFLGVLVALFGGTGRSVFLLWTPLPFYVLAIAYGSVPVFVPTRWPFSDYNIRYGLELLPMFAVFAGLVVWFAAKKTAAPATGGTARRWRLWAGWALFTAVLALVASSYVMIWRAGPICYQEAAINSRTRIALDTQLASLLEKLPSNSTFLMYLGDHVGALERAGIPLRRVINEGNHRVWKQPSDPDGLWERALGDPLAYADYVVAFEGDPVWRAISADHLKELVEVHTPGQPRAIIYQARTR